MSIFSKQVIVEYTAEQMYDLVSDIDSYPKFIPLCASCKILATQGNRLHVAFKIAKGPLSFEFTTINTIEKNNFITMDLETGPFKSLKGVWRFTPLEMNRSLISLQLEFEFSSKLFCLILDGLFNQLCDSMIQSFRDRAAMLYQT